jgi:D-3-phosphoglycerate dehydrogenase
MNEFKDSEQPSILCADHFYMSKAALKLLKEVGSLSWSKMGKEESLFIEASNAVVIASEYVRITPQIMDAASRLKAISVWGVGFDHVDVKAASDRGIFVTNCRGANSESVAEHTVSMILAVSRKTLALDKFVRSGQWKTQQETGLESKFIPRDLFKKTIGIIGFGEVGSRVARIAKGFDMRILAYDPYADPNRLEEYGAESVPLENLLKMSDFVTIHTVLSSKTRGMIGEEQIGLMKATAIIVNASRGAVVDQKALIDALEEKSIGGAGLDVFAKEPIDKDNILFRFNNVILSPHVAGGSQEALDATSLVLAEEIVRVIRNQIPHNLVNRIQLEKKGFLIAKYPQK